MEVLGMGLVEWVVKEEVVVLLVRVEMETVTVLVVMVMGGVGGVAGLVADGGGLAESA